MGPQPLWSHLDYCGGGEGYYAFEPLEREVLEIYLGEGRSPAFYATVDPLHRQVRYENALPHPAVIVRSNSSRVFHLSHEGRLRIEPGDILAAFAGELTELGVLRTIRENPTDRAAALVSRILEVDRGTIAVVRFIATEVPALAEESADMTLAVA
jgi:hypothetical protein